MNNEEMKKRIEELEKFSLNETKRLEEKIRVLENDLDDMIQEIEDANKVRRAVVEIQEFLTKKANGYDVNFHSYLIRLNK
jgi:CHASE3 domain sensor protein|tara:strand:- start:123 stop:362 length:240 start_codon:yes stop_codon:yes gene_type:complete